MLTQIIRQHIETQGLLEPGQRVLIGVSGGVDSMVLLHLLGRLGYRPVAAHVNHHLRADASDADEAFVRRVCATWQIPLVVQQVNTRDLADAEGRSLEALAREQRYAFFQEAAEAEGLDAVATAHHLDDQAETILLRLLRGAGPEGLAGIPARRMLAPGSDVWLVRPFLPVRREAIEAYARAQTIAWREDASNTDLHHRRNALRHAILPVLKKHFGDHVAERIARSGDLLRAYLDDDWTEELERHVATALHEEGGGGRVDLAYLRALSPAWQGRLLLEALRRWLPGAPQTYAFVRTLTGLLEAQAGRHVEVSQGAIWRERSALVFLPYDNVPRRPASPTVLYPGQAVDIPGGTVRLDLLDERPADLNTHSADAVYLDADRLVDPVVLRPWESGDRFQPLGMRGSKKVSDLLTDARCPSHQRGTVQVVVSGGDLLWVVGYRLSEQARIRPGTTRFAKIRFIRSG